MSLDKTPAIKKSLADWFSTHDFAMLNESIMQKT